MNAIIPDATINQKVFHSFTIAIDLIVYKILSVFLWLVALHSFLIGIGLIVLPTSVFEYLGYEPTFDRFFSTQDGVFHIAMSCCYAMAAYNPARFEQLIIFSIIVKFLLSWLSKKIESRIIGGKGESAITYIHIRDLCKMIKLIIEKHPELPQYDVYNASPDGSTSHKEIFEISTRYFFGELIKPIHLPKFAAYPALILRRALKIFHLTSEEPFEQFWMIRYIDKNLNINSSYTKAVLNWQPTARYHLTRRLLFLLEKLKSHPDEWRVKNEATLKRIARRTNLMIYEKMVDQKDVLLARIFEIIIDENPKGVFSKYKEMSLNDFQCYISAVFHLLLATIRSSDRSLLLTYIDQIAIRRFAEGFEPNILCKTLKVFSEVIINHLSAYKELSKIKQELYDNIGLSLQIAQDEIEDLYDNLVKKMPVEMISKSSLLPDCKNLQKMIHQLSAFYQVSPEDFNISSEELQTTLR